MAILNVAAGAIAVCGDTVGLGALVDCHSGDGGIGSGVALSPADYLWRSEDGVGQVVGSLWSEGTGERERERERKREERVSACEGNVGVCLQGKKHAVGATMAKPRQFGLT